MQIKVDEISKIIRQQIEGYDRQTDLAEVGTILSVGTASRASTASRRSWRESSSSCRTT